MTTTRSKVFCVDCKYYSFHRYVAPTEVGGYCPSTRKCAHPKHTFTDYVTGSKGIKSIDCKDINKGGLCEDFVVAPPKQKGPTWAVALWRHLFKRLEAKK